MDSSPLWAWINERHAIYIRKELRAGVDPALIHSTDAFRESYLDEFRWASKGYHDRDGKLTALTRDPILQQYRFCNVFRELDRVTAWIRYNIRRRYKDHPNLWLMLAIARYINWPDTLQFLMDTGYSWPGDELFSPENLGRALDFRSFEGEKVYTGAYMIRAESNPKAEWYSWTKQQYIARIVIGRLWENRADWQTALQPGQFNPDWPTMEGVWKMFQTPRYIGWGPFMAYQVCVDLRHTRYLQNAPDINSWAALGPGSRRGLNRLAGRPVDYPLNQEQGLAEMLTLWREQDQWRAPWVPPIELSDIQNALCETDKYLRVSRGEGRPRAQYVPGRGY